jgi:D-aminoacyl-tRNA deacylase
VIGLLQRVESARVVVDSVVVGAIDAGLLVLLCAEKGDGEASMRQLIDKLFSYRVFADASGKMNLALKDVGGGLLLVSQFTLAAHPEEARKLFGQAVEYASILAKRWADDTTNAQKTSKIIIAKGVFGGDMKVHLINDGPVTFWLQTKV